MTRPLKRADSRAEGIGVIRRLFLGSALAGLAAVALSLSLPPASASAAICSDHPNQASAQRAKDTRDADGDGIYCEDLPCPCLMPGDEDDGGDPPKKQRKRGQRVLRAQAVITHVVDGDTVEVETSAAGRSRGIRRRETIRLIGIDTPETVKPGTAVECGGLEAKDNMLRMAFGDQATDTDGDGLLDEDGTDGALVSIRTDPTQDRRDRYGRLLAYVDGSHSGIDVAKRQLRAGWAEVYVFEKRFQRHRPYRRASAGARDADSGVWGACGGGFHRKA
jgi:micrococcal nuclease